MITIENPSGTSLMRMTATNSDAQLAADIANAAADAVAERISEVMVIDKPSSVEEAEKAKLSSQSECKEEYDHGVD